MMIEGIETDEFIVSYLSVARDRLRRVENESHKQCLLCLFSAKSNLDKVIEEAEDKCVFSHTVSPADYEEAKNLREKVIAITDKLGENLEKRLSD